MSADEVDDEPFALGSALGAELAGLAGGEHVRLGMEADRKRRFKLKVEGWATKRRTRGPPRDRRMVQRYLRGRPHRASARHHAPCRGPCPPRLDIAGGDDDAAVKDVVAALRDGAERTLRRRERAGAHVVVARGVADLGVGRGQRLHVAPSKRPLLS